MNKYSALRSWVGRSLSTSQIEILILICDRQNDREGTGCFLSKGSFAKLTGASLSTIKRDLRKLRALGAIREEPSRGRKSTDRWILQATKNSAEQGHLTDPVENTINGVISERQRGQIGPSNGVIMVTPNTLDTLDTLGGPPPRGAPPDQVPVVASSITGEGDSLSDADAHEDAPWDRSGGPVARVAEEELDVEEDEPVIDPVWERDDNGLYRHCETGEFRDPSDFERAEDRPVDGWSMLTNSDRRWNFVQRFATAFLALASVEARDELYRSTIARLRADIAARRVEPDRSEPLINDLTRRLREEIDDRRTLASGTKP